MLTAGVIAGGCACALPRTPAATIPKTMLRDSADALRVFDMNPLRSGLVITHWTSPLPTASSLAERIGVKGCSGSGSPSPRPLPERAQGKEDVLCRCISSISLNRRFDQVVLLRRGEPWAAWTCLPRQFAKFAGPRGTRRRFHRVPPLPERPIRPAPFAAVVLPTRVQI